MQQQLTMRLNSKFFGNISLILALWLFQFIPFFRLEQIKSLPSTKTLLFIKSCVDGDTCTAINHLGIQFRLRLVGVDAPEKQNARCGAQAYASESRQYLQNLVENKWLNVEISSSDKYGRYIAEIFDPSQNNFSINKLLLQEGSVFAYRRPTSKRPENAWAEKLEKQAQENKKGLWSLKVRPQPPSLHRKSCN